MNEASSEIVVLGSLNLDYIASVSKLPKPGQTVAASGLIRRFGGKGANQAVAAARQGAKVGLIGCVGKDADGDAYLQRLSGEGIDTRGVAVTKQESTGTALIAVEKTAENMIIVAPGANAKVSPAQVKASRSLIESAKAVLLQFETPMPAILAGIHVANRAGVAVLLNPSPLRSDFPWGQCHIDTLIVNAGEAQAIFRCSPRELTRRRWPKIAAKWRLQNLIITRGGSSTLCFGPRCTLEVPALPVTPVDTVGAGDAFAGAFAALYSKGTELPSAIKWANVAGALTTLKPGAQEAMPSRRATLKATRAWGKP